MSQIRISAEDRTEFGKGFARRARAVNKVPAVVYGHGEPVRHILLPGHDLMIALRTPNVLLNLEFGDGKAQLVLPKDVQKDPVKRTLEHVDLVLVRSGEKVTVDIPITVTGEVVGGAVLDHSLNNLTVTAEATHIPTGIEVDVDRKEEGFQLFVRDLELPAGSELVTDGDQLVLQVVVTRAEVSEEAAEGEGDAEGEAAEGASEESAE
ncbi:ribosomal 5S rRNA E-loop binding protein Ctc/L25/TL5 [Catenulispora acidiphila DSM 44928]|uniref:Large ribosomal subunit protein bL25 n=1 Tax=Catenulispora acidiphila (strain DSM 44928 / JCM 14897 / NBRC 102108 / NRRL B-24433 / ID139908) TaxID=479433 RepID=C7QHI6_CATAD|nr:50S ribosomal protein L25/general stress protein Ctc [Catenulispora acidiphila]ACU69125.1 ribosomal 5S rRNA E-loop binding protein Ctc/L25/TL5 [Catenulispora acidiphila DSM 44928]